MTLNNPQKWLEEMIQRAIAGDQTIIFAAIISFLIGTFITIFLLKAATKPQPKKAFSNPDQWVSLQLSEIEKISHDVKRFRFALPSDKHIVGLPIGQHISLKYTDGNGKDVIRSYTPVSSNSDVGFVDFAIKVYLPNPPKFPSGGAMSQHLNDMKIGDSMKMRGPKGHLDYKGRGSFTITHPRNGVKSYTKRKFGMVAGGTGITPMLQIIRAILNDPRDKSEVWLLFANQTEEDIFLREELERLPKDRFHLWFTVDRPPEGWRFSAGFVTAAMCGEHLPAPSADTFLLSCGPPPMIKFACEPAFQELGFSLDDHFTF